MTGTLLRATERAWRSDVSLSALALFSFIFSFVLTPLTEDLPWLAWGLVVPDMIFSIVIITALTATTGRPWAGAAAAVFMLGVLAIRWGLRTAPDPRLETLDSALTVLPVVAMLVIVMMLSLRAGPVTAHRMAGVVLTYVIIAFLWAKLYGFVLHVVPGAIAAAGGAALGNHDLMYFSVMTLTTAGYGDVVPVSPFARTLASLEAIIGVLFPVLYISRFASARA